MLSVTWAFGPPMAMKSPHLSFRSRRAGEESASSVLQHRSALLGTTIVGPFSSACQPRLLSSCFRIHCSHGLGWRERKRSRRQRCSSHLPRGGVPNKSSPSIILTCSRPSRDPVARPLHPEHEADP